MGTAKSLADLMRIRALPRNRRYLDSINGNLGTALGFKTRNGEQQSSEPAIIVFVPEKINRKWIPARERIKYKMTGPDGLTCPLDIVGGSKAVVEEKQAESGNALAQRLRGWDDKVWCGSQISSARGDRVTFGTLGAFVRRTTDGKQGLITNDHVVINETVWHPWAPGTPGFAAGTKFVGKRQSTIIEMPVQHWYGDFAREKGNETASVRVDCAFVSLEETQLTLSDIEAAPLVEGVLQPGPFGRPFTVALHADMSVPATKVIGRQVYHVGRTTGIRKGFITAFAYEWRDQPGHTCYADFLLRGESVPMATGVEISLPSSYTGDSGTVLFALEDGEKRPLGLLWGGFQEQLRGGDTQENWSYATRIDKILDEFKLEIISDLKVFA